MENLTNFFLTIKWKKPTIIIILLYCYPLSTATSSLRTDGRFVTVVLVDSAYERPKKIIRFIEYGTLIIIRYIRLNNWNKRKIIIFDRTIICTRERYFKCIHALFYQAKMYVQFFLLFDRFNIYTFVSFKRLNN